MRGLVLRRGETEGVHEKKKNFFLFERWKKKKNPNRERQRDDCDSEEGTKQGDRLDPIRLAWPQLSSVRPLLPAPSQLSHPS